MSHLNIVRRFSVIILCNMFIWGTLCNVLVTERIMDDVHYYEFSDHHQEITTDQHPPKTEDRSLDTLKVVRKKPIQISDYSDHLELYTTAVVIIGSAMVMILFFYFMFRHTFVYICATLDNIMCNILKNKNDRSKETPICNTSTWQF